MGQKSHRQFAGPAPLEEMATTIYKSVGPSGLNKEYLYNLAQSMRDLKIKDEHLEELERAVKQLDN